MTRSDDNQPHLKRVLGRFDLVLLFVVAVFNLNVVPSIAANGGVTVWLWLISLLLFFWPQGIAVIELAHRYPGEGGVYLWAKEVFGDFHGFLSGWCYWTNNMLYVPTVMLYFVGVSVFAMGPGHAGLADNKTFAMLASLALLILLTVLNIVGLGSGEVAEQYRCDWDFCSGCGPDRPRSDSLVAFWHDCHGGGFSHPARSALRPEFVRRDLLWTSRPRTRLGDGRRNQRSAENAAPAQSPGAA